MNHSTEVRTSSLLHKFLVEPGYRTIRHIALIFILMSIAMNQTFMTLRDGLDMLGNKVYIQVLFVFITYLLICYFNLYVLLPSYLLKKKYVHYMSYLALTVFLVVICQTFAERSILIHLNILNELYMVPRLYLNTISAFTLVLLCVSGGAMTVLLKHWMTENEKVGQLERLHIQSQVEQLKEQVNPNLLFQVLNRTGVLAKSSPEKASDMIIRLSQLLRYQLYDCNREKVLLSAEIKFLNNYLILEQSQSNLFEFTIQSDKGCSVILVSPLLFISFVQSVVIEVYKRGIHTSLNIKFETTNRSVLFTCNCGLGKALPNMNLSKIHQRLELLYKERYSLLTTDNNIALELEI